MSQEKLADARYGVRELRAKDLPQIQDLVKRAGPWNTFLMRPNVERFADYGGWWYGALADGTELEALMCIQHHSAVVYGHNRNAVRAMADGVVKLQELVAGSAPSSTRHELMGPARTMDDFWRIMQHIPGRKLFGERFLHVMRFDTPPEKSPSKRLKMAFAKPADLRLVSDFLGEFAVEKRGIDPRRASAAAHQRRCEKLISAKRVLIGRETDKPVFCTLLRTIDAQTVMLDQTYVPVAFRNRKRLLGAAFYFARKAPLARDKTLLVMTPDDAFTEAAKMAGYVEEITYRNVVVVG